MKESLFALAFKRFKSNMSSYIAVGVFCGLFFILVSTLSYIDGIVVVFAVPILILPVLFASHVSCYLLEMGQPISPAAFFHYYSSFYRPQFRGSFRILISFLKSLAVYFSVMFVTGVAMFFIFQSHYGSTFSTAVNDLFKQYLNGISYEEMMEVLKENNGVLLTYFNFVSAIPIPFVVTAFMYFVSFSSISVYYRVNVNNGAPSLLRLGIAHAYDKSRFSMRKDWLKLNWPLLVLPIVFSISSGLICVFAIKKYAFLAPSFILGALFPLIFFLPFYFPNMEVLYHRYEDEFKEGNQKAIEVILARIQSSIELSEEEKRNLEESFKNNDEEKE